jgi:hypothetical protein
MNEKQARDLLDKPDTVFVLNIDLKEDEPLKQTADRNKLVPIELLKTILIEGYDPRN